MTVNHSVILMKLIVSVKVIQCESHPDQACGEPISHEVNLLIIVPITKLYCVVIIR